MSTTRITVDPDDPATFPKGRLDPAVVDGITEAEIVMQEQEDDAEPCRTRRVTRAGIGGEAQRLAVLGARAAVGAVSAAWSDEEQSDARANDDWQRSTDHPAKELHFGRESTTGQPGRRGFASLAPWR